MYHLNISAMFLMKTRTYAYIISAMAFLAGNCVVSASEYNQHYVFRRPAVSGQDAVQHANGIISCHHTDTTPAYCFAAVAGQQYYSTDATPLNNTFARKKRNSYKYSSMQAHPDHTQSALRVNDSTGTRILYATYFGGSGDDAGGTLLADDDDNLYIFSSTGSRNLSRVRELTQSGLRGSKDGLIAKFSGNGRRYEFMSYLGGSGDEMIWCAAFDHDGNIVVAGHTTSNDFPVSPGAFQKTYGGGDVDGFIAKFDSSCTNLIFASYIGGRGADEIFDIAIGHDGSIYAVGYTDSFSSFPRSNNAVQRWSGGGEDDMFLVVLDSSGRNLRYGTFLGGKGYDEAYTMLLLPDGSVAIGGLTSSKNINVSSNALQSGLLGEEDGLLIILDPSLETISYSTYFGGSGQDSIERMLYSDGDLFLAGFTTSRDLPVTPGVAQPRKSEPNGPNESVDSWLMRLNYSAHHIKFCTYLGGEAEDRIQDLKIANGFVITGGYTTSSRFPVTFDAEKKVKHDYFEAFISVMDCNGANFVYNTYVHSDFIFSITIGKLSTIICAGTTTSTHFPVTSDAYQSNNAGGNDAFIAIFNIRDIIASLDARAAVSDIEYEILSCAPHPFRKSGFTVTYRAPARGNVVLRVCDALGRTMERREENSVSGTRSAHFSMPSSTPGVYYCILEAGSKRKVLPGVKIE